MKKQLNDKQLLRKINKFLQDYKDKDISNMITSLNNIFSYFYSKKVEIKKRYSPKWKNTKRYLEIQEIFSEYITDDIIVKIEDAFFIIENHELKTKRKFLNVHGEEILRRVKAKYLHSKRFFLGN